MLLDLQSRHVSTRSFLTQEQEMMIEKAKGFFEQEYQNWYTQAYAVVAQLVPSRLSEFECLYKGEGTRKVVNIMTYTIQDWLNGFRSADHAYGLNVFDDLGSVCMKLTTQISILKSMKTRFESSLHDIKQLLQADLFDSEIDKARELAKRGYSRASGAICGVVIENHLKQVTERRGLSLKKRHPAISDYNELLKSADVIDIPTWRNIQRLADIRNICDHSKDREPTKEDVEELISGADKITKTIF